MNYKDIMKLLHQTGYNSSTLYIINYKAYLKQACKCLVRAVK